MEITPEERRLVLSFLRRLRGAQITPDDQIALDRALLNDRGKRLNELSTYVMKTGTDAIMKQLHDESLTADEMWMAAEMDEQLTFEMNRPENAERRARMIRETLKVARRSAAEQFAEGSEYADQFAALLFDSMETLRQTDPELAKEIQDDEPE